MASHRITILGWYNHSNCGDEAYKLCFPKLFPDAELNFTDSLSANDDSEFVVLGGGNVVENKFLDQISRLKTPKPIYAISVSIDKYLNPERLNVFKKLWVRDLASLEIAKDKAVYCPDIAFLMSPDLKNGKKLLNKYLPKKEYYYKVLVVVNSYLTGNRDIGYRSGIAFDKFTSDLSEILDELDMNCIFIPFSVMPPHDDRVSNAWVASKCKRYEKNTVIFDELNSQEILDLFSAVDFIISTRLHSTIYSCICNKPFVDISHHDKNLNFLKSTNQMDRSIFYWGFDFLKFREMLKNREVKIQNYKDFILNAIRFD